MVKHFEKDLKQLLEDKYKRGLLHDPYELVKEFCIDGEARACHEQKIPSVERKKVMSNAKNTKNEL